MTKVGRVPIVVGGLAERRVVRVSLVRGVRERSLGPVRRTLTFGQLLARFGLGRSRMTRQISGDEATIAGTVQLLGLGRGMRRVIVSRVLAAKRTHTLLKVRSRRRRCVVTRGVFSRGLDIQSARGLMGDLRGRGGGGGRRGRGVSPGLRTICRSLRRRVGNVLKAGMYVGRGSTGGKGLRVRCCSRSRLSQVVSVVQAVRGWV